MTSGPPGDDLPGERTLATYRGGLLRLTDRRVAYRGRGLSKRLQASVSLEAVTGAGIARRAGTATTRFGIPLSLVLFGFWLAFLFEGPEPLFMGILVALGVLPLLLLVGRNVIQIGADGYLLQVPVARRHDEQARHFLAQLDLVRFSPDAEATGADGPLPTTQPYGAASAAPAHDPPGMPRGA